MYVKITFVFKASVNLDAQEYGTVTLSWMYQLGTHIYFSFGI